MLGIDPGESHAAEALVWEPIRMSQQEGGKVYVCPRQPAHVSLPQHIRLQSVSPQDLIATQ